MGFFFSTKRVILQTTRGRAGLVGKMQKLTSPVTHSQVTLLTQIHNSVISKQTSWAKERVTIGRGLNGVSDD